MLIEADFSAVPDVIKPIGGGLYDLLIQTVEVKPPKDPTTLGNNIILKLEVVNEGPNRGRTITDYIFISSDPNMTPDQRNRNLSGIKRVALSAGLDISNGINVPLLQSKIVKAAVANGIYKDEKTGVTKETANVAKYFIPTDAEYNGAQGVAASVGR